MRILHVIYDDIDNPWLGGGGATRTLEIYSRIAQRGHTVHVLSGNYPGAPRNHARENVSYRHIGSRQSYVASRLTFSMLSPFLIKRGGYDIVIEDVSPFSPVGAPIWVKRVPTVASVQNLSGKHALRKYGVRGVLPRLVERPLLSLFRNFIAVSPGIAEELRKLRGAQADIRVVPNSAGEFSFVSNKYDIQEDKKYILFLGRIDVYQKGLDILLDAFDRVATQLPDIKLVIAGGGTEQQLAKLASLLEKSGHKDRIEITGQVNKQEAARLMKWALMLAMPSRYEAWPLTAIEAGAAGTPVVGFDIVGVRDAGPPYPAAHGFLVPGGEGGALADKMIEVANDPGLRSAAAEKGRAWAARFTWDALAGEQLAFYEELTVKKRA
jgi:glycosyltransferase involved in cell wall biosynthesis